MIKKLLLAVLLINLVINANSQTTYYWVGGTTASSIRTNANWNTALNGSGSVRTVNGIDDVLIFDGTNIGGATPKTGNINVTVSSDTSSKFIIQNSANVYFTRPIGAGGSATLSLMGGTGEDLMIDASSSVTIGGAAADGNVILNLFAGATGVIAGKLTLSGTGVHRFTCQTIYGVVFQSTSVCTCSTTPATSGYPFGSATQGKNLGLVFQSGATLITSGTYSPMGGSSTYQAALLLPGSRYYIKSTNAASTGSWIQNKYLGHVYIQNGSTFTCDGSILYMDSLTIDAGCTFTTHTSGTTPIINGSLVVNGTLGAPTGSLNTIVLGGNGTQTVTGSGTINIPSLTVGDNSDLSISNNLNVTRTAQIIGKINFGTSVISGAGTFSSLKAPSALAMTGNVAADSLRVSNISIGGIPTAPLGVIGLTVTGAGIQPNTTVVSTNSGNFYLVLSKPATTTGTAVSLTFGGGTSTLSTSNANGFDSTNGCVKVTGTKTYQAGINYVINAATSKPIGFTSGLKSSIIVGNLTINAPTTTNKSTTIKGVLTLNSGNLSVRPVDTIIISKGASIAGSSFSNTKHIALNSSGANLGSLKIDSFANTTLFPVGDATNYLPVTLSPTVTSSFTVNAFQGATVDGTLTGTPLTALEKTNIVDANWNIHREVGANGCDVTLGWPASLEGTNFIGFSNAQIGISHFELGAWGLYKGSGDNVANTATYNFNSFSPFRVGKTLSSIPIISGTLKNPSGFGIPTPSIGINGTSSISGDVSGNFTFNATTGNNYTLRPSKNNDSVKNNGVSVIDAILVQSHVLSKTLLNSPYKIIAADVNNSGDITAIDILFIKRLALGIDTTFTGKRLWGFVDGNYAFPDSTNPFPFKDSLSIASISANAANQNFIGVKLGDVNYNWDALLMRTNAKVNKPIELYYENVATANTNEVRIPIRVKNFKQILGLQYTINFNSNLLELKEIDNNLLNIDYGINKVKEGKLSFIWNDANSNAKTLNDGSLLFELVFTKKANINNEALNITSDISNIEAWDENFTKHNIILNSGKISNNIEQVTTKETWTVLPNISDGIVNLNMVLSESKDVQLSLSTIDGKQVFTQKIAATKGTSNTSINLQQQGKLTSGIYYLKATGITGEKMKQVMIK